MKINKKEVIRIFAKHPDANEVTQVGDGTNFFNADHARSYMAQNKVAGIITISRLEAEGWAAAEAAEQKAAEGNAAAETDSAAKEPADADKGDAEDKADTKKKTTAGKKAGK